MKFDSIEKYSIFALNNLNMKNADCEGNMAVGKNITLENFSIGIGYTPTTNSLYSDALVIGGNVNIKNSVNYSGNTIVQRNRAPKNYKMSTPKGSIVLKKVFDFQECGDLLKDISTRLKQRSSNALVENTSENTFELVSIFKNEIQVFNLDLNEEQVEELNIYLMVDNRSPIIINVNSEKLVLKNIKVYFNNQLCSEGMCSRILWNFHSAKEITILNSKFYGTILGVNSAIYLKNSLIYGSVFGGDIFGDSDVVLCKLDIALCRYLSDFSNYSYESHNGNNVKLKNKFIDPYYSHSNTVTSGKSNTSQSITKTITTSTQSKSKSGSVSTKYNSDNFSNVENKNITPKLDIDFEVAIKPLKLDYIHDKEKIERLENSYNKDSLNMKSETKVKSLVDKNIEIKNTEPYIFYEKDKHKYNKIELIKEQEFKNNSNEIGAEIFDNTKNKVSPENFVVNDLKNKTKSCSNKSKDVDNQVILNMLNSITHEEEGIAEILKAEAFKIKKSVELAESIEDFVKLDESLSKTVRGLNSLHSLLQYKFEEVMKISNR